MNTTLRMKIVFRTPNGGPVGVDPVTDVEPGESTLPAAVGPIRKTGVVDRSGPGTKGGSTDPKEFLAMHARLKYERARARRYKQVGLLISVAAVGAAATVITWARQRHHHDVAAIAAAPAVTAPVNPAVVESAPAVVESAAVAPAAQAVAALEPTSAQTRAATSAQTRAATPAATTAVAPRAASEAVTRCADDFGQRRWREAAESCTLAFEERADAAIALRVGHAQFASDHVDQAGIWAAKAIELGSEDADAFVLIGHAERQAGHPRAAMAAYRRYLQASPRGWHARNVRAALRDLRAKTAPEAGQASAAPASEPSESIAAAPAGPL
jgi:hypothetical protein